MLISVITINRNNNSGLLQTIQSVEMQTSTDFEYIIVDGASTDNSVETIREHSSMSNLRWISEPDTGIYNAMNKGIRMATGEYVLMLNSGDRFINQDILSNLTRYLKEKEFPDILYGNTVNTWPDGRKQRATHSDEILTMMTFYISTLDHVGTCIRRSLFDQFGMYDETMKICSDWAWFMKTIVYGNIHPVYVNLNIVYFDMTGISESGEENQKKIIHERRKALEDMLPPLILADYDFYGKDALMIQRLHRHPWAYRLARLLERTLFKIEKIKKWYSRSLSRSSTKSNT